MPLTLTRKTGESVVIDLKDLKPDTRFITITMNGEDRTKGYVSLSFDAPRDVAIIREEILDERDKDVYQKTKRRPILSASHKPSISKA